MKNLKLLLFSAAALVAFGFAPDGCDNLIFFKEGTKTTLSHYNDDGKPTGATKTTYKNVSRSGGKVSVTAVTENYDKKGKLSTSSDWAMHCENGTLSIDLKSMMPQQQADAYKDFELQVEGMEKEFPSSLAVGSTLKDANVKFTVNAKGGTPMPMMNMSLQITNRKVEAKENIATPAGTFECFRISEDSEMKTIFKVRSKNIYWFSYEVGVVKLEVYKENGKLMTKSELTELTK